MAKLKRYSRVIITALLVCGGGFVVKGWVDMFTSEYTARGYVIAGVITAGLILLLVINLRHKGNKTEGVERG